MPSSPASKVFSSSSSSSTSIISSLSTTSDDLHNATSINTVKFICSYGGRILPRYPDAKLRYTGGENRIITVHHSISFSELVKKLGEMYGLRRKVVLRCQFPSLDLDVLVSITSDEDLRNMIEEYDQVKVDQGIRIRAFLDFLPPFPSVSPILLSPPTSKLGDCHHHNHHQHSHHNSLRGRVYSAYKHQFHHQNHHHCQQLVDQ